MGIYTVSHLLEHFPYRYEDYAMKDLAEVKHDERVTVEGKIHSAPLLQYYGKKKSRLTVRVLVGRYLITAVCFNRPYYKQKLKLDETVTITGINIVKQLLYQNFILGRLYVNKKWNLFIQ